MTKLNVETSLEKEIDFSRPQQEEKQNEYYQHQPTAMEDEEAYNYNAFRSPYNYPPSMMAPPPLPLGILPPPPPPPPPPFPMPYENFHWPEANFPGAWTGHPFMMSPGAGMGFPKGPMTQRLPGFGRRGRGRHHHHHGHPHHPHHHGHHHREDDGEESKVQVKKDCKHRPEWKVNLRVFISIFQLYIYIYMRAF